MASRQDGPHRKTREPHPETVEALVKYGYRADSVWAWPAERAEATLRHERTRDRVTRNRALSKARREGEGEAELAARGQPTGVERVAAAAFLEGTADIDDLTMALSVVVGCLTDGETRTLARVLARRFRRTP